MFIFRSSHRHYCAESKESCSCVSLETGKLLDVLFKNKKNDKTKIPLEIKENL